MSFSRNDQNVRGGQRVNASVLQMKQGEFTETFGDLVGNLIARVPGGCKGFARLVNTNVRTVENWRNKRSTPTALNLLVMMATVPEVQAEVRRLTGMEADMDPMFERDLQQLFKTYQRVHGGAS